VAVDGANRPDCKLVEATLNQVQAVAPPPEQLEQNLCLDKGFDYVFVEDLVADYGYTAHIRSRGEEKKDKEQIPGFRARRWVWNGRTLG
jgi:hypothetical protein